MKLGAQQRGQVKMFVFSLRRDQLLLLDSALQGRLANALAAVARQGGDPELRVERMKPPAGGPSSWVVVVHGGTQQHRFEVNDLGGLGVVGNIYLSDHIAEIRADLSERFRSSPTVEQLELDFQSPWPRQPGNGGPS